MRFRYSDPPIKDNNSFLYPWKILLGKFLSYIITYIFTILMERKIKLTNRIGLLEIYYFYLFFKVTYINKRFRFESIVSIKKIII